MTVTPTFSAPWTTHPARTRGIPDILPRLAPSLMTRRGSMHGCSPAPAAALPSEARMTSKKLVPVTCPWCFGDASCGNPMEVWFMLLKHRGGLRFECGHCERISWVALHWDPGQYMPTLHLERHDQREHSHLRHT